MDGDRDRLPSLGLANDPPRAAPVFQRRMSELGGFPGAGRPAEDAQRGRRPQLTPDLAHQNGVFGQARHMMHGRVLLLAGLHDRLAAEAVVPAHDDPRLGTAPAQLGQDRVQRGLDVRFRFGVAGAQLRPEHLVATHPKERLGDNSRHDRR